MVTSVRDQALELHNLGIQVVPALSPRTHRNFKRPSIPWQQFQDALVSREQVELLARYRAETDEDRREAVKSALLLSINCIAVGFGATG